MGSVRHAGHAPVVSFRPSRVRSAVRFFWDIVPGSFRHTTGQTFLMRSVFPACCTAHAIAAMMNFTVPS